MRKITLSIVTLALLSFAPAWAEEEAPAKAGSPAPAFTATDIEGKSHELAQYKGKLVVLEWLNHGCPFVKKHYGAGNMQKLQEKWTGKDVVWLSVISSSPGSQGHGTPAEHKAQAAEKGSKASAILIDEDGKIGRLYGAMTTPHMYVVDKEGVLAYKGAIDSVASPDPADIDGAENYVDKALAELSEGKAVSNPATKSYGCGVKYSD